jgi:hypothetical protein
MNGMVPSALYANSSTATERRILAATRQLGVVVKDVGLAVEVDDRLVDGLDLGCSST